MMSISRWQVILNMLLKFESTEIDRNRPQYHISTEMDCNTTWRQVSPGTSGPLAETHAKWVK